MIPDALAAFQTEIARFEAWADAYPLAERSGEWELDYGGWPRLYSAFDAFVSSTPCQWWSDKTTRLILYAIARDNEIGYMLNEVRKNPQEFLCLAEHAVNSPEKYARSQIASALGQMRPLTSQVEGLLLRFAEDNEEYVRRLAMSALADVGSVHAAELVPLAWDTDNEHQRMAALYVLWRVGSAELERYLAWAEADGRPYLADYAARVRSGNPG